MCMKYLILFRFPSHFLMKGNYPQVTYDCRIRGLLLCRAPMQLSGLIGCVQQYNAMRESGLLKISCNNKVPSCLISFERGAIKTHQIRHGERDVLSGIKKSFPRSNSSVVDF